jgi:hypothetical protein
MKPTGDESGKRTIAGPAECASDYEQAAVSAHKSGRRAAASSTRGARGAWRHEAYENGGMSHTRAGDGSHGTKR